MPAAAIASVTRAIAAGPRGAGLGDRVGEQVRAGVRVPERGQGAGFPDALDAATARTAIAEHLRHGTTSLVASLVTADEATLLERTCLLAGLADVGELAGIHLEGPYLSPARCGAQDPALMTEGRPGVVREIARVARGHLVTMTVAPEVPGVLGPDGVVAALAETGALPSFGHTDAGADLLADAIAEAGAAL